MGENHTGTGAHIDVKGHLVVDATTRSDDEISYISIWYSHCARASGGHGATRGVKGHKTATTRLSALFEILG